MGWYRNKRRWILGGSALSLAVVALFLGKPAYIVFRAWVLDKPGHEDLPPGYVDDASRMNSTRVAEVWDIPADFAQAEEQLRRLLQRARADGLRVSVAGARHSMGGHTIYPEGIVLNMLPFRQMELDTQREILQVGAGARWADILPYLNERNRSIAIMQSNNSFSVGGSISVNCHGWQHNRPPIASSVDALRLMKADGAIVRCSRTENAELFSLVLGGYGLFGIILDVDLRVVPNERYSSKTFLIRSDQYVARFRQEVDQAEGVGMVYGRLCVVPGKKTFLRDAILNVFYQAPSGREQTAPLNDPGFMTLRREVYRGSIDSPAGKEFRWSAEKKLGEHLAHRCLFRNQLLNESVEVYQERSAERTDILHEYFLSPSQFEAFLQRVRAIVPKHHGDLLNVTVRNVLRDPDTVLRYADQDMFAFVMLFSQQRTPDADARMEVMTGELVDAAVELGGRYYLPYRLHATKQQMHRAYPQAREFFEQKRRHDPEELFQNEFYRKYGRP